MKDYTKYDFAAIVGAEVEMKTRDSKGTCWSVKGKVLFQDNGLVWIERSEGKRWNDCIIISEIVSDSLTAKIKVEDMSVKQLKKAFNLGTYEVLVFNEATGTIANRDVDGGELGHTYEELPFNDYIDCTEWGWKE